MVNKKEKKPEETKDPAKTASPVEEFTKITTKKELKSFLLHIKNKFEADASAPIYCVSAMNYVMQLPEIYELLDKENKEIAQDIWLRIKNSGFQKQNPPLLFDGEEIEKSVSVNE